MLRFASMQAAYSPVRHCLERAGLTDEWSTAAKAYAEAVHRVNEGLGLLGTPKYQELKDAAKALRLAANDAANRLDRHKVKHGC